MVNIVPIVLLAFGWIALWLLYLNQSASKIHEATVILAATILGTLLIIAKGGPIEKKVTMVHFLKVNENRLVFFDLPVLREYNSSRNILYYGFLEKIKGEKRRLVSISAKIFNLSWICKQWRYCTIFRRSIAGIGICR